MIKLSNKREIKLSPVSLIPDAELPPVTVDQSRRTGEYDCLSVDTDYVLVSILRAGVRPDVLLAPAVGSDLPDTGLYFLTEDSRWRTIEDTDISALFADVENVRIIRVCHSRPEVGHLLAQVFALSKVNCLRMKNFNIDEN